MKCRRDFARKLFAQLNTPLIVRINIPDASFNKSNMLIEAHELAERKRREFLAKNGSRGTVSFEDAGSDHPFSRAFGAYFVGGFTKRERLSLCKEVSEEELVYVLQCVLRRVNGVGKSNKVAGNFSCSLVNKLVKCMLAVGSWLAPKQLTRLRGNGRAVPTNRFSV